MNEANTRAELIEPLLEQAGWGRNFPLTKIDREVYNHFRENYSVEEEQNIFLRILF